MKPQLFLSFVLLLTGYFSGYINGRDAGVARVLHAPAGTFCKKIDVTGHKKTHCWQIEELE